MSYRSQHRLSKTGAACQVITYKEKKPQKQPTEIHRTISIAEQLLNNIRETTPCSDVDVDSIIRKLDQHGHAIAPERTSHPSDKPVSDIALVTACHGKDKLRLAACKKALPRLLKANPQPAGFFIVEALEEHQESDLGFLKEYPQVTYIRVTIKDKNKYLFQKEALWTIATKKAFENPNITKVVAIDADCAYDDNSWAFVISRLLDKAEFVQPFAYMNYSQQKDSPLLAQIGEAYAYLTNYKGKRICAPGGSFSCTRHFFETAFKNRWPYRPIGSGDVATWVLIEGDRTESYKKPSNIEDSMLIADGQCPYIPINYARMILNHYYHGPISNRMYVTRNYLAKKYNNPETVAIDDNGLLAWTDTQDGQIFHESFAMLKTQTQKYTDVHRQFTLQDTKNMTKLIACRYYGVIGAMSPLIITTVYRYGYDKSPDVITHLYNSLKTHCKQPFQFIVFTDTQLDDKLEQYPLDLDYHDAPSIWRRMSIFSKEYNSFDNVLFIDPSTEIVNDFTMLACQPGHLYLARHETGRWDSAMMYFKDLPRIWEKYKKESQVKNALKPEYIYLDPATYLLANWHDKDVVFKNLIIHADYKFKNERMITGLNDFILK